MRVALGSVDVDEHYRRMIACYDGEHGTLASRDRVRSWVRAVGRSNDDDAMQEYDDCEICHPPRPSDV